MPLDGTQLGQYFLVKLIGTGGTSEIYLANDLNLEGRQVAIKVVRTEKPALHTHEAGHDTSIIARKEALAISKLDHPHILSLFYFGEELQSGVPLAYMVMPYLPEGTLRDWVRKQNGHNPIAPHIVAEIIDQAADALQYAHNRNIIHRDVKPSNFLVRSHSSNSAAPFLLLADFGIAKMDLPNSTLSTNVSGTVSYMAPERWANKTLPASDQYSLAIIAYSLLTGRPPFQGDIPQLMHAHCNEPPPPPSTFNPRLSANIDSVLLHALEKEPAKRYKSITDFAHAFKQAVSDLYAATTSQSSVASVRLQATGSVIDAKIEPPLPAGQTPVPRQPHQRSRLLAIALFVLAFLVILSSISYAGYKVITDDAAATATAIAQYATATATVQRANPEPTQYVPPRGTLALLDHLNGQSVADKSWQADTYCEFKANTYHVYDEDQKVIPLSTCFLSQPTYSSFAIQVNMVIRRGDCGGIVFRANPQKSTYYIFRVCQDNSNFYLYRFDGKGMSPVNVSICPISPCSSSKINTGLVLSNSLAIVVNGSGLSFYINQNMVGNTTDSTYLSGAIGFSAYPINNPTEVWFSNLKVWTF